MYFNLTELFLSIQNEFQKYFNFQVKDCDPETGEPDSDEGYNDEYVLEDLEISMSDFVQRAMKVGILISRIFIIKKTLSSYLKYFQGNFAAAWEELGAVNELEDTYDLSSMKTLDEAVKTIGMYSNFT